jgi:hypothetical protein
MASTTTALHPSALHAPAADRDSAGTAARDEMLLLVDFKWLMAGLGWWIDLNRWRRDPGYARDCIARGCRSSLAPLRRCARQLLARAPARG